jgi:hypothetical protein
MTVADNLRMYGFSLGKDKAAIDAGIAEAYAVFPRLSDRRNQLASTLSGGEQQMLGLSKALIVAPRVLLIDEFSLGLAPVIVGQLMETVRRLNARGTAVLLVEQSVNVALSLVDRVYFMEKGRITYEGRAEELRADPELVAALSMGGAHVEELVAFEEEHEAHPAASNGHVPQPVAVFAVAAAEPVVAAAPVEPPTYAVEAVPASSSEFEAYVAAPPPTYLPEPAPAEPDPAWGAAVVPDPVAAVPATPEPVAVPATPEPEPTPLAPELPPDLTVRLPEPREDLVTTPFTAVPLPPPVEPVDLAAQEGTP